MFIVRNETLKREIRASQSDPALALTLPIFIPENSGTVTDLVMLEACD